MRNTGPDSLASYIGHARKHPILDKLTDLHLAWLWDYGYYLYDILTLHPQPSDIYNERQPFKNLPERLEK